MSVMASTLGLGILISLHDQASKGLELLKNQVSGLKNVSEDMVKSFDAGLKQLAGGIASVYAGMQGFNILKNTFSSAIETSVDFEYAMARVKAVTKATGEAFNALQKQASDLGRETQFTAIQAANSQELLARAGFDYQEIIASMPGLLNMANAEGMELANAADIAANTLRGFGLQAEEMNKVADILAKTSSITNTSIATLGESFKYIAPNARILGISIEEVAAMVGVLGDVGIKGSQAGNYLKMAFNILAAQPKQTKKVLEELGITVTDSNGNMLKMGVIMEQLASKMQGLGTADKAKALTSLFGQYAVTSMTSLLEAYDTGKLDKKLNEIKTQSAGAAKEMADIMNDTVKGAIGRMSSAMESLRKTIGDALKDSFRALIEWLTSVYTRIDKFMQEHPVLTKAIIKTTALILALVSALLVIGGTLLALRGLSKLFILLKVRALNALTAITGGTGSLGKAFLILSSRALYFATVAGLVYYAWRKNLFGIRNLFTIVTEGFKMMINASKDGIVEVDAELAKSLQKAGLWDYAVNMGKIFWRIRQLWEGVVEGFEAGVKRVAEIFKYVGDIIASIFQPMSDYTQALGLTNILADTSTSTWRDWGKAIGEFIPIIFGLITAFKLLKIVSGILTWLAVKITALSTLAATNPLAFAFRIALTALMTLYFYSEDFRNLMNYVFRELGKVIEGVFTTILGVCQTVIGLLTLDFEKMKEGIQNIFSGLFSGDDFLLVLAKIIGLFSLVLITGNLLLGLVGVCKTITIAFGGLFASLWATISGIASSIWGILTATFSSIGGLILNPITLAVIGVIALIVLLYAYWDEFKNWFVGLWQSFAEAIGGVCDFILGIFQFVIGLITLDWGKMVESLGNMFKGLVEVVKGVVNFILKLLEPLFSAIRWVGEKLGLIETKKAEVLPIEAASEGVNTSNNKAQEFAAAFSGSKPKNEPKPVPPVSFSQTGQIPEIQERIIQQPVKIEPAAPILAQQNSNQASFSGQAISGAINENSFRIKNDTKVDVKIQPSNTVINIDGDRVGEAVSQYIVKQNVRQGASEIE